MDGGERGSVDGINEVMVRDVVYVMEKCLCSIKCSSSAILSCKIVVNVLSVR